MIFRMLGAIVLFIAVLIGNLLLFEQRASVVSEGEPIAASDEVHPALLVIDVQEATTGKSSLNQYYMAESEDLIPTINGLAESFHLHNLPVIYIRSEIRNHLINLLNSSYAAGSLGARFDKRLNLVSDMEVVKSRNDAFFKTSLDELLRKHQINQLYIAGLDAAHCINTTVAAAQNRNYDVALIRDAILSESEQMKDSMMTVFQARGVQLIRMDSLTFD
jgi:nicotinamidase/pyrazinamidase